MTRMSSFTRLPEKDYLADEAGAPDFGMIHDLPEFRALRRRVVRFVFPAAALFFCWYLTYVLLAAYAEEFMATPVFGSVNVGLLLGLSQFLSTVLIMTAYSRFARRKMDPQVSALRARAGGHE
ncbi:DUF485 domain-containing protein [Actinophytocola sediminis]